MPRGRRRTSGGQGRREKTFTRAFETYEKKLEVINHFRRTSDVSKTLDAFYEHLSQPKRETQRKKIYAWMKQRSVIEGMCRVSTLATQKSRRDKGTATVISRQGEEQIKLWINSQRSEGVPVSSSMLQGKACLVAEAEGIEKDVFTGAWSWRKLFLQRHGFSFRVRTRQGQRTPPAMETAAIEFWSSVERVKCELGVSRVYNADQSAICFEYLPKRTVSSKGENTVWIRCGGKDKERFTGMFLADSDGNQYPPFFVLKTPSSKNSNTASDNTMARRGFGSRLWKEIKSLSSSTGAQIYGNRCGWWNSDLTVEFLDFHFADRSSDEPVLLLLDDFSPHWTADVASHAEDLNVLLLKVPPGLTSVCQPADVAWFGPLKRRLREKWVQFLTDQLREHDRMTSGTPFKLQAPTRTDAIQWACRSWNSLGSSVVKSGFKKHKKAEEPPEPPRNDLVERLEQLSYVVELIRDSDDVVRELE